MPPYVYIAASNEDSLTIIDVADPAAPDFAGHIAGAGAPNFLNFCYGVAVQGLYAYVASVLDNALSIFDISNPAAPVIVGSIQGVGAPNFLNSAHGVYVLGNYCYVCSPVDNALSIFDISNPAAPVIVGSIQGGGAPPWLGGAWELDVIGNYAYVCATNDNSLTIIDVTNPAAPAFVGSIRGAGAPPWLGVPYFVHIVGNLAYIACSIDDALTIIDITNPALPVFVGSIQGAGAPNFLNGARGVFVRGNYAYVTAQFDNSLTIIDVAIPAAPAFASNIAGAGNVLMGASGVIVDGDYAYVSALTDDALTIIDITNPLAPVFSATIQGAGFPNFLDGARGTYKSLQSIVLPTVTTGPATAGPIEATLNGTLTNDGGEPCSVFFEYGTIPALGLTTGEVSGYITGQSFSQLITGLTPGQTYYYRAAATNSVGTSYGAIRSFICTSPSVSTLPATFITENLAQLNGQVAYDAGYPGDVSFEWGTDTTYGQQTPWQGGFGSATAFSAQIAGLGSGTVYHFRARFRNKYGIFYGVDQGFSTLEAEAMAAIIDDSILLKLLGVA